MTRRIRTREPGPARGSTPVWPLAVLLAALAACGDEAAGPPSGLTADERVTAALVTDAIAGAIVLHHIGPLGGFGPVSSMTTGTETREFERSRACPAGGIIAVEGTAERTHLGEGLVVFQVLANGTWDACAFERRDLTITIDGQFTIESERRMQDRRPVGPQTTTKSGRFTWTRSDGRSGECEFEVTSVRNPDAGTRTVTGTVCGRTIDRAVTWHHQQG